MHALTLIVPANGPALLDSLAPITTLRSWLNPVRVIRLSPHALDFHLEYPPSPEQAAQLRGWTQEAGIDAICQPIATRAKRLLISDMDSTMIDQECIDELADCVGLKEKVSAITARAMNGELDFKDALRERVALLADLPETALAEVFTSRITPMAGAKTLVATMKARGAHTVLVSGGFTFFTARVAALLGFDGHEANRLELRNGKLTGRVVEPILDKHAKKAALYRIAQQKRIPLAATLAVGDGANDLPMIEAAGLGVAYHAKPVVVAAAPAAIRFTDLTSLLYAQGIPHGEWVA